MAILILLTYPLFSHVFILAGNPQWASFYLLSIVALILARQLIMKKYILSMLLMCILIAGAVLVSQEQTKILIYFPPILISLGLLLLFGRSLHKGRIPLITRYAQLIDDELKPEIMLYTRRVTQIWAVLFLFMFIESIVAAIFFPLEIWSLVTNFLNYLIIMAIFVAEFIYRKITFPNLPKRSFIEFLQKLIQIRPSQFRM